MERLVQSIAKYIREHVIDAVSRLTRQDGEIRTVFHGPPMEILRPVFDLLVDDGGIDAVLFNGDITRVPILLVAQQLGPESPPPRMGESGICTDPHIIDVRNDPSCPRFVVLVEPGHVASLSVRNASDSFGLSEHNNSGTADIAEWWGDAFVQGLVTGALDRHTWTAERDREHAQKLIQDAVFAADKIDKNVASRHSAWRVLSRVWAISSQQEFGSRLSLACGFPPCADGSVNSPSQEKVIDEICDRFVDSGFRSTVEELKLLASEAESRALDEFLAYVQERCGVATTFAHAPNFYYEPSGGSSNVEAPAWWTTLTLEVWQRLLDSGEDTPRDAVLTLECQPILIPKIGGTVVVGDELQLRVLNMESRPAPDEVTVKRDMRGAGNREEWRLKVGEEHALVDGHIPKHSVPVRYSVEGIGIKKTTVKVVSLAAWEPGVVVYSRTAAKMSLPKAVRRKSENVSFDLTFTLSGQGRHYVDVYVRPGVTLGAMATASGDDGSLDSGRSVSIGRVGETDAYGFEVEATGDCFYQFEVTRDPTVGAEMFRVYLSCDEAAPEECGSEFERLIRLNRPRGSAKASTDVNVNRQLRCADLQGWALGKGTSGTSFRPIVLGPDYADVWRATTWASNEDTIFSRARFLHDPRPILEEMAPPARFLELRAVLFETIRGAEENGLIEAAPLGKWLATDQIFAQQIEEYVQAYSAWLSADPDSAGLV